MRSKGLNDHLTTGAAGIALIKHFESLHDGDLKTVGLQPKLCPAGYWTEGYGHMMRGDDGKPLTYKVPYKTALARSRVKTEADASRLLAADLREREAYVKRVTVLQLMTYEFDALVSFQFNLGTLGTSTLLKELNAGRRGQASAQFLRWVFATDPKTGARVKMPGLIRRRNAERALFDGADWTVHLI